jgi:hypothetical protein
VGAGVGFGLPGPPFVPPPTAGSGEAVAAGTGSDDGTGSTDGAGSTGADGGGSTTGDFDGSGGGWVWVPGASGEFGRRVEAGDVAGRAGVGLAPTPGPGAAGVATAGVGSTTAICGVVDSEMPTPRATPANRMLMIPSVSTSRSRCAAVTSIRHSRS